MCFTVEIDKKQFPDVSGFINQLDNADILYMSNEYDISDDIGDCICYRFEFDDGALSTVSPFLAELVKKDYLNAYADNIISANYYGIEGNDKKAVIAELLDGIDTDELTLIINEFLAENMHIHLGGFVLFRMKEYLAEFENEIDFVVDEYIQQKRYRDFVRFLEFFVDNQESAFDAVNLLITGNDYLLLDGDGNPISEELLDSTYCEISALEDDDGYIMLNDLISLAPKHITIHCKFSDINEDPVKIIREIFTGRVNFCHHCSICLQ